MREKYQLGLFPALSCQTLWKENQIAKEGEIWQEIGTLEQLDATNDDVFEIYRPNCQKNVSYGFIFSFE